MTDSASSKLKGVSETLLIPLYARYRDNRREQPLLVDPMAAIVVDRLKPDFTKFPASIADMIGVAARGNIIDEAANNFVRDNPGATIVNLGAGLCTRYDRLKYKPERWIDIDFPDVEHYWKQAFNKTSQRDFIVGSVTDEALWQRLGRELTAPVMFIAEGLLMYLTEAEVKQMFGEIAGRFPEAHFLAEVIPPFFVKRSERHPSVSRTIARFKWGLKSAKELEGWRSGIKILNEWRLMEWRPKSPHRLPRAEFPFNILRFLPPFRKGFRVIHVAFKRKEAL